MRSFFRFFSFSAALAGTVLCAGAVAFAQLTGDVTRVLVRPANVKAEFTTFCGGQRYESLTQNDVTTIVDGAPVEILGFRCPDPGTRPYSAVLLLDVSEDVGQMRAQIMRDAARSFVDSLDGVLDEASVMMYNAHSEVIQQMTTIKPMLYSALERQSGIGERHTYDALYHAVEEVSLMPSHNTTAVIHFVAGPEQGSSEHYGKLLSLARQRGVRIYSIAFAGWSVSGLESLVNSTGGSLFRTDDVSRMRAKLTEIRDSLRRYAEQCSVVLPLLCTDGDAHALTLHVSGCNDTSSLHASYIAPENGVPSQNLFFSMGKTMTRGLDTFRVPITLHTVPKTGVLYPALFWFGCDPARLTFIDAEAPPGGLLHGVPLHVERGNDYIKISTDRPVPVSSEGLCLMLTLAARGTLKTVETTIRTVSARSLSGCGNLSLNGSNVTIYPNNAASVLHLRSGQITASGMTVEFSALCDGNSLLAADSANVRVVIDGVPQTLASPPKSLGEGVWECALLYSCTDGRSHHVQLTLENTCSEMISDTLTIPSPLIARHIVFEGPEHICAGDSTVLDAGAGYAAYRWSTGETSRRIVVHKPDVYIVAVESATDVCDVYIAPAIVSGPVQPRIQPPGPYTLCRGATRTLTLPLNYASYRWSNGSEQESITVSVPGEYFVTVTDQSGCIIQSDTVHITQADTLRPVITPGGVVTFCEGAGVELDAGGQWNRYLWSNGHEGRRLYVHESGNYSVRVWNETGCTGESAAIPVMSLPNPKPRIEIEGSLDLCEGDSVRLSLPGFEHRVLWITEDTISSLMVRSAGVFWASVRHTNGCQAATDTVVVRLYSRPPRPDITRVGNRLQTIPWSAYQWYLDGAPIPGATSAFYDLKSAGGYQVEVFNEHGCSSISRLFDVNVLDAASADVTQFRCELYPEPVIESVTVDISLPAPGRLHAVLSDMAGRAVLREEVETAGTRHLLKIDVSALSPGVYIFRLIHGNAVTGRVITKM
ncbi:MAG: VWA domain-containing protein [Bacteroidia bacterium]|nr:VWA domain-containing protein [Bacteroidia bacterium]